MQERRRMSRRILLPVVTLLPLLAVLLMVVFAKPAEATTVPAGFEDRLVADAGSPTALAFTPDGRMLIATQPGQLKVYQNGRLLSTPALDLSSRICSNSERGLLGVTVDPNFSSNHYIYVYYTFKKFGVCEQNTAKSPVNRVARYTLSDGNIASGEKVLIDNIPSPNGNHNAGDLHFGKDNYLYVSVGDGGCSFLDKTRCQNDNNASRYRNVLLGKVLRITRDGGIPSTNPFQGTNSARCNVNGRTTLGKNCRETFARGFRNPFRMAFDPNAAGTRFYVNDVGGRVWEEIDRGKAGADYGWNVREGHCATGSSTNCGPPPKGMTNPISDYNHNTGCSSITGGAFVPSGAFPAGYNRSYLFGDYVCGKIFKLTPRSGGGFNKTTFVNGLGRGGPVDMAFGPYRGGKALYYTTYASGSGQVRRIDYTVGNRAPNAVASASPRYGQTPLKVNFDGRKSSDPDGNPLTYNWTFGDGTTATGPTATHTYTADNTYVAALQVKDNHGAGDTVKVRIDAGNTPPAPRIRTPLRTTQFRVGQRIVLRGVATDAQDGRLADSKLNWRVIRHHNNSHTHPFLTRAGNNVAFRGPAPEDLFSTNRGNYLEIQLTATDSKGLKKTVSRRLYPDLVYVRFASRPINFKLRVNGVTFRAPKNFLSWVGYKLDVVAPRQRYGGKTYVFHSWSDRRAASHTITTPAKGKIYVARFKRLR